MPLAFHQESTCALDRCRVGAVYDACTHRENGSYGGTIGPSLPVSTDSLQRSPIIPPAAIAALRWGWLIPGLAAGSPEPRLSSRSLPKVPRPAISFRVAGLSLGLRGPLAFGLYPSQSQKSVAWHRARSSFLSRSWQARRQFRHVLIPVCHRCFLAKRPVGESTHCS